VHHLRSGWRARTAKVAGLLLTRPASVRKCPWAVLAAPYIVKTAVFAIIPFWFNHFALPIDGVRPWKLTKSLGHAPKNCTVSELSLVDCPAQL
jgi:hypothetical protein